MNSVLDRAVLVFREHGYGGASIDSLRSATGLTAGSLYKAFRDKRQIFVSAFSRYVEGRHAQLSLRLTGAATGRARLAETLRFYIDSASGEEGRRGCLVLAGLVEVSTLDEELRTSLDETLECMRLALLAMLHEGQRDGSVRPDLPVGGCADLILNLLQGLRAVGKLRDPADRDVLVALALKILD